LAQGSRLSQQRFCSKPVREFHWVGHAKPRSVPLAKELATLQDRSNGRLILDAGVGWLDADAVMKLGADPRRTTRRTVDTQAALDRGVFGAPSYVIGDEIFWGQDRLDFVDRKLARGE
jgi:hypothetical protein